MSLDQRGIVTGPLLLGLRRPEAAAVPVRADADPATRERLILALQFREAGLQEEAELLCRDALHRAPADPEVLRLAGQLAHESGHEVEALELIDRASLLQPESGANRHARGDVLLALGRPDEALAAYRAAIGLAPDDAAAWLGAGNALRELERLPEALRACEEAVRLRPVYAEALLQQGMVLGAMRRPAEALVVLESAARARPDLPVIHDRLGCALATGGRWEEAIEAHRRAIALDPRDPAAYCHLGAALGAVGRYHDAADALQAALTLEPDSPDAHNCMGTILRGLGYLDQAASAFRQALAGRPDFADAHFNLGMLLAELDRPVEALSSYRATLAFRPDFAHAHARMGAVLVRLGRSAEAITAYRQAIGLLPDEAETWFGLGGAMREEGRLREAVAAYGRTIELCPDHAAAHYQRGLVLLSLDDFPSGWEGYEWRARVAELRIPQRDFGVPRWAGEPLEGRTVLVHAEPGIEDTLRFARYLPLVVERGGRVVVECQAILRRLLEAMPCIAQAITVGEALPAIDCHIALPSLPALFTPDAGSLPTEMPYLPTRTWSNRVPLLPPGEGLRIGIAWTSRLVGGAVLPPATLAPLLAAPGATWYSLDGPEATAQLREIAEVHDLGAISRDLADTAALMGQLDLVVTTDSAIADLAGGLGIPMWVLLSNTPGWQWGAGRDTSRWYPRARLFRQSHPGAWAGVIDEVRRRLGAAHAG